MVDSSNSPCGHFYPIKGVSSLFLVLPFIIEIPVLNANNVDPGAALNWPLGINGIIDKYQKQ